MEGTEEAVPVPETVCGDACVGSPDGVMVTDMGERDIEGVTDGVADDDTGVRAT